MDEKDLKQKDMGVPTIEELMEKISSLESNWKRALADYKNLQRRTLKENDVAIKFSNYVLIAELIPVYENLKMVEKHSKDVGLKMIISQFEEILKASGVEKIKADGEDFDENVMEAIETKEGQPGKVLEVLQNGYKFKDRLIRPVKVIVGKDETDVEDTPPNGLSKTEEK